VPKSEATIQSRNDAFAYRKEHRPGAQRAFPHVDLQAFVAELDDRIDHPKHINQGQTNFCGPAAVLYALAKEDPVAYVKLALDLFVTGTAKVRGWTIDAGPLKDQAPPTDKGIGCCDWLMMSCVRRNVGFGALSDVCNLAQGTMPAEIAASLQRLGYGDVRNETYSSIAWKADEKNLIEASNLWKKGYRVILFVNDNMFKQPDATSLKPDHWCTLKSEVITNDKTAFCKMWQWGVNHKEPDSDLTAIFVNLPKKLFIHHYFGYVAGGDYTRL
jgi:hypothetical protein